MREDFLFCRICAKKTGIPFQGYHMDLGTLKKYKSYGKKLTESDRKRLKKLSSEEEFREITQYMLEENVKLEQECVIEILGET